MTNEFPSSYVTKIKALDAIIFLAGLFVLAYPAIHLFYPGAIDTTVHITFGALIAVCAVFRVLVAYGSAWLEIVLIVLGAFTLMLPKWMHVSYDPGYRTAHLVAGGIIVLLALVSAVLTFAELGKRRQNP